MGDAREARARVRSYLERRLAAIMNAKPGRPILMLSGGIDSVTLAAALRDVGANPLCVTVTATSHASTDRTRAAAVAAQLNLEHRSIDLADAEIESLVRSCIERIKTDELWEIGAAVPIRAVFDALSSETGPVLSGAGADVLFAGGLVLDAPPYTYAGRTELRDRIWASLKAAFCYERLVPDFFHLLLQDEVARFFEVYQTVEAWKLTADFAPEILYAQTNTGELVDKQCIRDLAIELGVDPKHVWARKDPLQFSSGIVAAFTHGARRLLATDGVSSTYGNPEKEQAELTAARLWLRHVKDQSTVR